MRKLIVEAPELKEGQSDSSGGIRENGKMSVQYKNPVPYVEPTIPPVVPQKTYTRKDRLKEQAKDFAFDISYIGHMILIVKSLLSLCLLTPGVINPLDT